MVSDMNIGLKLVRNLKMIKVSLKDSVNLKATYFNIPCTPIRKQGGWGCPGVGFNFFILRDLLQIAIPYHNTSSGVDIVIVFLLYVFM